MSRSPSLAPARPKKTLAWGASLPKPRKAGLVLTGTGGLICAILMVWLIVMPLFRVRITRQPVLALGLPTPEVPGPFVAFPTPDARLLAGAAPRSASSSQPALARLKRDFEAFFANHHDEPVLIYLTASAMPSREGVVLVSQGDSLSDPDAQVPLGDLIRLLRDAGKGSDKLLALDVGQAGPNRELGLGSFDFPEKLREMIGNDGSMSVLLACEPGQMSWVAEGRGCSVFAHYLAEALSGPTGRFGRVTAEEIEENVRPRVQRWVAENRGGAVQTPILVGARRLQVHKSRPNSVQPAGAKGTASASAPGEGEDRGAKLRSDLLDEWRRRQVMAKVPTKAARRDPLVWRRYQVDLLRAETLVRSGSDEAGAALKAVRSVGRSLEQPPDSSAPAPWSLALAREARVLGTDAYERNVKRLVAAVGDRDDAKAVAAPPDADAAGDDAKKQDDAPAAKTKGEVKKSDTAKKSETAKKDDATRKEDSKEDDEAAPGAEVAPAPALGGEFSALMDAYGTDPLYVEAQVPVWYAEFAKRGGESPALRKRRKELVVRAFELRQALESAAVDERVSLWTRPTIDKADPIRRRAQDLLFGSEPNALTEAAAQMAQAETLARQAQETARAVGGVFGLLDGLREDLPFLGEWMARRGDSLDDDYATLLDASTELSRLVRAPVGGSPDVRPILALTKRLSQARAELGDLAEREATRLTESGDWREVDAILQLPTIDPKVRGALLARAGSEDLTRPLESDLGSYQSPSSDSGDPAFLHRALGLARLEVGLLRLAGLDEAAGEMSGEGWSALEKNPEAALSALANLSARARQERNRLAETLGAPAEAGSAEASANAALARRDVAVLPLSALPTTAAATGRRDDPAFRQFLAWHASRLSDDFAGRQAWQQIVSEAGAGTAGADRDDELTRLIQLAGDRADARLTLATEPGGLKVERAGNIPAGIAAAFVPREPGDGGPVTQVAADSDPSLPGPEFLKVPAVAPAPLRGPGGRSLGNQRPIVFYRGRFATADGLMIATAKEPVTVQIRQALLSQRVPWRRAGRPREIDIKIPDQFIQNGGRGFVHPGRSIEYVLALTNTSDREIAVKVEYGYDGPDSPKRTVPVTIPAGGTNVQVGGMVRALELAETEGARNLKVVVTEDVPGGARVAQPLLVPFRIIKPAPEYVHPTLGFVQGSLIVRVTHMPEDPVTQPVHLDVIVTPINAVSQWDDQEFDLPLGRTAEYRYRITKPVEALTIVIKADAEVVFEQKLQVEEAAKPKPPAPPPPPDGGP